MARSDNQRIMTKDYPIFEWATGAPRLDYEEYENKIAYAME